MRRRPTPPVVPSAADSLPSVRRAALVAPAATLVALVLTLPAFAQPFPREDLPPELRPWVAWVLDEVPDLGCARVQGRAVCAWPGRLRLDLAATGGRFELELEADRALDLRLPGSAERWPLDVRLDERPVPAFERAGEPHARVGPGRHRVAGRFSWARLPESLSVPPEIGLLELSLDGRPVARPRREAGGLVWLRARDAEAGGEGESLRLQVFRHVADGIPVFVETRLQLEVAGRARELRLPEALLPATAPVAVSGDLPARVEDGALRIQVRGGRYAVSVRARVEGRPEALARPAPSAAADDWPEREVWVFEAAPALREVELSGAPAIDPSRTELPDAWRALPAFLVEPGARLALRELRRGQAEAAPDALTLAREIWLDPSGDAASVRDRFSGVLHGTTRLDLLPPGLLGRVAVDGQDQLVTANPSTGAAGVELRRTALGLEADSRLKLDGAFPAVGWSTSVERLQVMLHLPPGWSLLGARGVDSLPGTWTSRWTLLGFFFVLLAAFAAYRLFGAPQAALAIATLVLVYGEPGAPFLVWLSLLGAIGLRRAVPNQGRLASLARVWFLASVGVLVLLVVPFARDQVRDALFPQVAGGAEPAVGLVALPAAAPPRQQEAVQVLGDAENVPTGVGVPGGVVGGALGARAATPAPSSQPVPRSPADLPRKAAERVAAEEPASPGRGSYLYSVALEQDPKAVLQTGPGLPAWQWRSYTLSWTGPVGREDTARVFLASPALNRLLTLLRLALLGLLGFVLVAGRWPRLGRGASSPAPGPALGLALLLLSAPSAQAQPPAPPSSQLLQELKRRLTRPAPCEPRCVVTPSAVLRLAAGRFEVSAEVHAAADGTWAVPGPLASWAAATIRVDGATATAVALLPDGFLHVRLPRGVHRLEVAGPAPAGDSFTLQFAEPPRRARAEAAGWEVSGLRADAPPDASVLFSRRLEPGTAAAAAAAEGRYAPWLEVTRTIGFGVSWSVETRVRRVTPPGAPIALRVPLLPGEGPTRADLVTRDGEVAVSLAGDEIETGWQSTLEQAPELALVAPEGRPWSEVWRLQCSTVWSCAASGLPPVTRVAAGVFAGEFRPWPGESLKVALAHPAGVEGETLTLDAVALATTPGTRLERAQLSVTARSSREQPLVLQLPAAAEVQQVSLDGAERPARPEAGALRVTVPAGTHRLAVRWQQPGGMGTAYALPRVGLPGPAVNVSLQLELPPSRWLLVTHGPAWGPAVLFWPYLVFLLAVAALLGRLPASPLASRQWVLLGLGLSQISALGALVVAGFVFALGARRWRQPARAFAFDAVQLLLALWALVSLALVYGGIHTGLLFRPDMQVAGAASTDTVLRWYADRVAGETPAAGVVSLPLWVYRVAMLLWALWLAASLVRAVGWGWRAFGAGGYWRALAFGRPRKPAAAPEGAPAGAPQAEPDSGSSPDAEAGPPRS